MVSRILGSDRECLSYQKRTTEGGRTVIEARIQDVSYVNAKVREGISFHLAFFGEDFDDLVLGLIIRDEKTGRNKRLGFAHFVSRESLEKVAMSHKASKRVHQLLNSWHTEPCLAEESVTWDPRGPTKQYIGEAFSNSLSRAMRHELAAILASYARLEIGFCHTDIETELFEDGEWYSGGDEDNDKCGCRFLISLGDFKSDWWLGWYRVKPMLLCTREEDQEFDKAWKYRDNRGWGLEDWYKN